MYNIYNLMARAKYLSLGGHPKPHGVSSTHDNACKLRLDLANFFEISTDDD